MQKITNGSRVAFSRQYLASTGQVSGDKPFLRGKVAKLNNLGSVVLAEIQWDNGQTGTVNIKNLVATNRLHLEPS